MMGVREWLGLKSNGDGGGVAPVPQLEQLEPRLLLSADLLGMELGAPLQTLSSDHTICVDLDQPGQAQPEEDASAILAYLVSPQESGEAIMSAAQAEHDDSLAAAPLGAGDDFAVQEDSISEATSQVLSAIEIVVDSGELTLTSDGQSACLIPVDRQGDISNAKDSPIEARGPPVCASDALSILSATTCGEESQPCAAAEVESVSTENSTKAPELSGLVLVDPDISNWQGQIIYLDFDGQQNVTYHGPITVGPFNVPVFQALGGLAGHEAEIIAAVTAQLNDSFAETGVCFTIDRPQERDVYSTIYIGGDGSWASEHASFFGLAEQVDIGNQDSTDNAFVFTDRLSYSADCPMVYADTMAGLIAHEIGHLLGYEHAIRVGAAASPLARVASGGQEAIELFSVSPALFVENAGQWADESVRYVHNGDGISIAMTDSGIMFQVFRCDDADGESGNLNDVPPDRLGDLLDSDRYTLEVLTFSASFVGARTPVPVGREHSDAVFNYFLGDQTNWREGISSYEMVAYGGLYDGIDLFTWGLRSHLKYEFHVAPENDWSQIAIRYEGIEGLSITEDGSLLVDLGGDWGVIQDDAPYLYQQIDGRRVEVTGRFVLLDDRTYSFEVTSTVDPDHELVIDPDLAWSTYLGGSGADSGSAIAVDGSGNVYVTGTTQSSGWTSAGFDTSHNGSSDGFVVKFSSDGAHLWSTYLGGSAQDYGTSIAVDSSGNVYLTGTTQSSDWASGGFDTSHNGYADAFVAKFNSAGAHVWSTYLGGSSTDSGSAIAVDGSSNVYLTGTTQSSDWTSGGFDGTLDGANDVFIARLSSDGAHLWSTYLGGSGQDYGNGIAADDLHNVYVAGHTGSSGWTSGGFDTSYGGGTDAFVAKLNSAGVPVWSTYLGDGGSDYGRGIALDTSGSVYVTGSTQSAGWMSGGFDMSFDGGPEDAFIAKLGASGMHLWSTCLGGTELDRGNGICVDPAGNPYVTGRTNSSGWTSGGLDTTLDGASDAFVAMLSPSGAHLWSTYVGGSGDDYAQGIAWDALGGVSVTGYTASPWWTNNGFDTSYNGAGDAFVARIFGQEATCEISVLGNGLLLVDGDTIPSVADHTDFGVLLQGGTPITRTFTVRNDGTSSLILGGADVPTGFTLTEVLSDSLAPGEQDTFTVRLDTAVFGIHSGDVSFAVIDGLGGKRFNFGITGAVIENPAAPIWSTYVGGSGVDHNTAIAVDAAGSVYVTGYTASSGWTSGGFDENYNGNGDAFVAKFSSGGAHLWSTYIGGTGQDYGYGIAVDASGNVYVAGNTKSSGWTNGGFDASFNGGTDVFVTKLSSSGFHVWSTYLGGNSSDYGYGIGVDASGDVYVTGSTQSTGWTSGGFDTSHNGEADGFVAKLSSGGAHLWSSYLGGVYWDYGRSIAVQDSGTIQVTGQTGSSGWANGGYDVSSNGGEDGFVVSLSTNGEHLWSTYLGGGEYDDVRAIAVDGSGNIYVTGETLSRDWTSGGFDTVCGDEFEGFVIKLSASGAHLWSTYLGGDGNDWGKAITVGSSGIYVMGYTQTMDWASGLDTPLDGTYTAFLAKLSSTGGHYGSGSLTGAESQSAGGTLGIVTDSSGNVYVAGSTQTDGWASDGYDTSHNGCDDGFLVKNPGTPETSEITVLGNGTLIIDGDTSPGDTDQTDFGGVFQGDTPVNRIFTVRNDSTASLALGPVTVPAGFALAEGLSSGLAPGESDTFTIRLDTSALGTRSGDVSFVVNGDAENPFNFAVTGLVSEERRGLAWSTYLGGTGEEEGLAVAVDEDGNVYIAGETESAGWISGGLDTSYNGDGDFFVAKFTSAGVHVWSTYLGGADSEDCDGLAAITVDADGYVYVTGSTQSDGWVSGGFDTSLNTYSGSGFGMDAFVVKLSGSGAHMWSTYLGGSGDIELGEAIAVDDTGNVYVAGHTGSSGWVSGGFDTSYGGDYDGFIVKLTANGAHAWSSYLGGASTDEAGAVCLDGDGNVYVMGDTCSAGWTSGGFDTVLNGEDIYVVKLTNAGIHVWSTYVGGADGEDFMRGGTVDAWGNVYVAGGTTSAGWVSGGFDTSYNDDPGSEDDLAGDGFVVKLTAGGNLAWSTYLGGENEDWACAIAVDAAGSIYVSGDTESSGWVSGGFDLILNNGDNDDDEDDVADDGFVAKLTPAGGHVWSTYLGGNEDEGSRGIAVDALGCVYVTGTTESSGWTSGGFDTTFNGEEDGFIAKLATVPIDQDRDGVPSAEEQGPDGDNTTYDGNNDGTPDLQQGNVASFGTVTEQYVTLACGEQNYLANVQSTENPSPTNSPVGMQTPYGFFNFEVGGMEPGGSAMVEIYVPDGSSVNSYYKYGPTPDDPTPHWYEFDYDGQTGAEIVGDVIRLYFVDGLRGDDDLIANARIVEPGAPVRASLLRLKQMEMSPWGFVARFNHPINTSVLNLYDTMTSGYGPADVTVVGQTVGSVAGSLLVSNDGMSITFIKTGGPFEPDTYTLTFRSAANGFKDTEGRLLDGDQDGFDGGDYVTTMTVAPSTSRVVSVPDFCRGPGQAVDVPATGAGIPIKLSDGTGVQGVKFVLRYDPTLLTIASVSLGGGLPADWSLSYDKSAEGQVSVTIQGSTALSAGAQTLVVLEASVPADAPYSTAGLLELQDVAINAGTIAARADSGIEVVAYLGDATGNHAYSGLDASYIARVSVGLDSGFAKYRMKDPVLIGDTTGNGKLSGLDASYMARKVVGLSQPQIPDLPGVLPPIVAGGVDPLLSVGCNAAAKAGETITLELLVDDATGVLAADIALGYDTAVFDLDASGLSKGALTSGWTLVGNVDDATGQVKLTLYGIDPLAGGGGSLAKIAAKVREDAPVGPTRIDLMEESALNEGELVLTLADGQIEIQPKAKVPVAVNDRLKITLGPTRFDSRTGQTSVELAIRNVSATAIGGPVWLALNGISDPGVSLIGVDGVMASGLPYIDLSGMLGDGLLSAGETVKVRLCFHNPLRRRFTFDPLVFGVV